MIARMTDRGLPIVDGAPACPFVAFADDREARATSPDHRHRCYAEVRPAERALAHQEAYCLSSSFPVCPTFQDWARREAAAARPGGGRAEQSAAPAPGSAASEPDPPARAPHRDWSAPPHWASSASRPGGLWDDSGDDERDGRLSEARYDADQDDADEDDTADARDAYRADDRVDERANEARDDDRDDDDRDDDPVRAVYGDEDPMERSARRRAERAERVGRHRAGITPEASRQRSGPPRGQARQRGPTHDDAAPSWERPRRFEAYPTIRTRVGLPGIPRLGLIALAILVAGVALFFLPALLGVGGPDVGTTGSPSPSAAGSPSTPPASLEPTPTPLPTPVVYVIQSGDTLSKIATRFGVSLQDILAANKDTITDPNKIKIGDRIVIPIPVPTGFVDPGASESLLPP